MRHIRVLAALIDMTGLTASPAFHPLRHAAAGALCAAAWRVLPGYAAASLLLSAVLTQVVATAAASYDLSHLALEAMLRVYVVELLPLAAAVFVAMRSGLTALAVLPPRRVGLTQLRHAILPTLIGHSIAVASLTLISIVLALLIVYPVVHGFAPWGLPAYTRLIGQVFDPVTALVLIWKVLMFGLAIGLLPALAAITRHADRVGGETRALALLLAGLVAIELIALAVLRI